MGVRNDSLHLSFSYVHFYGGPKIGLDGWSWGRMGAILAQPGSARLCTARLGYRFDPDRPGSAPLCPAWSGSARLGFAIDPSQLGSAWLSQKCRIHYKILHFWNKQQRFYRGPNIVLDGWFWGHLVAFRPGPARPGSAPFSLALPARPGLALTKVLKLLANRN